MLTALWIPTLSHAPARGASELLPMPDRATRGCSASSASASAAIICATVCGSGGSACMQARGQIRGATALRHKGSVFLVSEAAHLHSRFAQYSGKLLLLETDTTMVPYLRGAAC